MIRVFTALFAICFVTIPLSSGLAQNLPEETVYVDRAVLAYTDKHYEAALKELAEALRVNADSYQALYYQGLIYIDLNRLTEAQAALEKAHKLRPQSQDISFQLGVLYVKQGEFDQAEPLLQPIYTANPERPNLGFYLGLTEYRKKNYQKAADFLRANVPSDDDFAQLARFYSGLAMSALGFPREARQELNEALRSRPGTPIAASVPRFNDLLEKGAKEESRFRAELQFGFLYDSNPVSWRMVSPCCGPTFLQKQHNPETVGELVDLDLSYMWLRTVDWEGSIGYRLLNVEYNQDRNFSTQSHSPSVSVTHRGLLSAPLGDLPYFAGLQWVYDYIMEGKDGLLHRWTINHYYTLVENSQNMTNLQFRFQVKNFFNDASLVRPENRDALNYTIGPTHFFLFENGRHYLKIGYQYDYENAEGQNWTYSGNRLLLGFQYTLPWYDVQLRYDFDNHWRSYRHPDSLVPQFNPGTKKREDREGVHSVSLSKDFTVASQKFNLSLEYLFDDANSNLAPFSFTRHIVLPSVAWRF